MKVNKQMYGIAAFLVLVVLTFAGTAFAQQASITLKNSNAALCHSNNTEWTIEKEADISSIESGGTASWTVTVTKGATTDDFLTVQGFMAVQNTGSADATIGNIVVNLQRKEKKDWVTKSSDVADATSGDAAESAKVIAKASSEGKSSFSENAASGKLEFTDADSNTIWAIQPQQTIAPGATVNLLFSAKFNNSELGIPEGELVRAEVIVSFGNAGARGGSGASGGPLDINGNGVIDSDEAYVRSVPTRLTLAVPALKACNASVTLTDPGVTTSGTVTASNFSNGAIGSGLTLFDSASYEISATVDSGAEGGEVCNEAFLKGEENCSDCAVKIVTGYDQTKPIYGPDGSTIIGYEPIYYEFPCCDSAVDSSASACIKVDPVQEPAFNPGDYCTYIVEAKGWDNPNFGGKKLVDNFYTVYPPAPTNTTDHSNPPGGGIVEVGIPDAAGYSMIFKASWKKTGQNWNVVLAPENILAYLPGNSPPAALTGDLVNPDSTSSQSLGSKVLALQLNVDFSDAEMLGNKSLPAKFGDLKLCNLTAGVAIGSWTLTEAQATALNGKTVRQVLDDANKALGGGGLPGYVGSFANLTDLLSQLNGAFYSNDLNCKPGEFATLYMCKP